MTTVGLIVIGDVAEVNVQFHCGGSRLDDLRCCTSGDRNMQRSVLLYSNFVFPTRSKGKSKSRAIIYFNIKPLTFFRSHPLITIPRLPSNTSGLSLHIFLQLVSLSSSHESPSLAHSPSLSFAVSQPPADPLLSNLVTTQQ